MIQPVKPRKRNKTIDKNHQPFKVGDFVKLNPKYAKKFDFADLEILCNLKIVIERIEWIGFGDDYPYSGCQSGWIVFAKFTDINEKNLLAIAKTFHDGSMKGYDSQWFIKWEKPNDKPAKRKAKG